MAKLSYEAAFEEADRLCRDAIKFANDGNYKGEGDRYAQAARILGRFKTASENASMLMEFAAEAYEKAGSSSVEIGNYLREAARYLDLDKDESKRIKLLKRAKRFDPPKSESETAAPTEKPPGLGKVFKRFIRATPKPTKPIIEVKPTVLSKRSVVLGLARRSGLPGYGQVHVATKLLRRSISAGGLSALNKYSGTVAKLPKPVPPSVTLPMAPKPRPMPSPRRAAKVCSGPSKPIVMIPDYFQPDSIMFNEDFTRSIYIADRFQEDIELMKTSELDFKGLHEALKEYLSKTHEKAANIVSKHPIVKGLYQFEYENYTVFLEAYFKDSNHLILAGISETSKKDPVIGKLFENVSTDWVGRQLQLSHKLSQNGLVFPRGRDRPLHQPWEA